MEPYEKRLRDLLAKYYHLLGSKTDQEQKMNGQIDGFLEALICAGVTEFSALQAICDDEHKKTFGVDRNTRKIQNKDWSDFDLPAFERTKR